MALKTKMKDRRYAPLINIAAAALGVVEGVLRSLSHDYEGASDSVLAASYQLLNTLIPYVFSSGNRRALNTMSAFMNGTTGLSVYGEILFHGKLSRSISLNALPLLSTVQLGTNSFEKAFYDMRARRIIKPVRDKEETGYYS